MGNNIGLFVKAIREEEKMDMSKFGEKLGVSPSTIMRIENGTQSPKIEMLQVIARKTNRDFNIKLESKFLPILKYLQKGNITIGNKLKVLEKEGETQFEETVNEDVFSEKYINKNDFVARITGKTYEYKYKNVVNIKKETSEFYIVNDYPENLDIKEFRVFDGENDITAKGKLKHNRKNRSITWELKKSEIKNVKSVQVAISYQIIIIIECVEGKDISKLIKKLRGNEVYLDFEKRCGKNPSTISRIEKKQIKPTYRLIQEIADALDLDLQIEMKKKE